MENVYLLGSFFRQKPTLTIGGEVEYPVPTLYILAQVGSEDFRMISMSNGNRWSDTNAGSVASAGTHHHNKGIPILLSSYCRDHMEWVAPPFGFKE